MAYYHNLKINGLKDEKYDSCFRKMLIGQFSKSEITHSIENILLPDAWRRTNIFHLTKQI